MNIYTSYWAQVRNFPKDLIGINTTIWPPKWRPLGQDKRGVWVIDCPLLKPGKECEGLCSGPPCSHSPATCDFLLTYERQLSKINFEDFIKHLNDLRDKICKGEGLDDVDFAFIFFEKPDNPCSERRAFTDWFWRESTNLVDGGIAISEWNKQKV